MTTQAEAERALTAEGFTELVRAQLESEIEVFPARAFYPSSIGHPCDRALVWAFTRWQTKARHDVVLQAIFDEGRLHQPSVYRRLEAMGFEVVRESDRPVQYRVGRAVISGRPDGRIVAFRGVQYRPPAVLEAKSLSGYAWDQIGTSRDLLASESPWTRSYYAQGHMYALLENTPRILFVLKNKQTGMLKALPDELDYGYAESILQRVERLQPLIEEGRDPDPIPFSLPICGGCGWRDQCYPARSFGEGASVIEDPVLLDELARREILAEGKREYDQIDRAVKDRLKREGIKFALAGDFVIEGKLLSKKAYTVPARDEVQYSIRHQSAGEA
jgi:hypothetical protein